MNMFLWPISIWQACLPKACASCASWKLTGMVGKGSHFDLESFDEDGKRECWTVGKCNMIGMIVKASDICDKYVIRRLE